MKHDPINPDHFPSLHAFLKSQAMLPWADKLEHIAMLVKKDTDAKEDAEAVKAYSDSKLT